MTQLLGIVLKWWLNALMHKCTTWIISGWGWGLSKVFTFNHVGGSLNLYKYHHRGCLNNPIFSNLGLCAVCWARFMYHYELWPTSVSHPFSHLNSSSGLAEGNHYPKITIAVFRLVLQNFAPPGCVPCILFCCYLLSLLSSGWFVIAVCGSISVWELTKWLVWYVNQCRAAVSNGSANGYPIFVFLFY